MPYCKIMSTGWQRLIGCLDLQVIFRQRATNHRALLRKMTCKDKASYGSRMKRERERERERERKSEQRESEQRERERERESVCVCMCVFSLYNRLHPPSVKREREREKE